MLPQRAYQIIHHEVMLDSDARFNLATFVSTWLDEYADRLHLEAAEKNMIDKDEYPRTAEIEERCRDLADIFLDDLTKATEYLQDLSVPLPTAHAKAGFSH